MKTLAALLFLALPAAAQDLSFQTSGKEKVRWSLKELAARSKPLKLSLENGTEVYQAIPLAPLLKAAYGDPYKNSPDFFFVCKDGYRAPVPAAELAKFPAYLAIGRADGKPFVKEKSPLGPFYLVWDSQRFPQRKTTGSWPYQVVAIDKDSFNERYPKVPPRGPVSAQVQSGFKAFRKYCISCHQINGQGGKMGIDLNSPVSVTEYIKEPYLTQIIDNPAKVRGRSTMPIPMYGLANRKQLITDIVAYLKHKSKEKR